MAIGNGGGYLHVGGLGFVGVPHERVAMSTIEEVRAAEKKVQEVLETHKKAGVQYPNHLSTELNNVSPL